ncbi:MAG TPA: hypothetical protein VFO05_09505 [Candidatus Limnocylindrales bacterium]|nr:hypothetical protein [Candidatus Limnocylindrales bacterium]
MRPSLLRLGVAWFLVGSIAGCEMSTAVPAGAQVVDVTITESAISLEPDTVRAGDVYLALDSPPGGSMAFVARQDSATATPGPLDDDGIERLRRGDTFHTMIDSLQAGGCSPDQDAAARGRMGHCGNVMMIVVSPGRYAIVGGGLEGDPAGGGSPRMAILTVVP